MGPQRQTGLKVEVRVFATLRRHLPDLALGGSLTLSVDPGTTLEEVRDLLGLPAGEVKIVMRNSRQAAMDETVAEGDRIAFIPAVAGG